MKKNSKADLLGRYTLFILGLFIAAMGVALSTKAKLGTSPVSSVPYSVSLMSGLLSFGGWLNVWSVLQISIQVLLLRKKCNMIDIAIQTVLAFVYGYLTNFACFLIQGMNVEGYFFQFLCMLAGCFVTGFGIWVQLKGNVAMLPGEAMNRAISTVSGKKYEDIKIFFDIVYILISAVLGICFLGGLKGVREGSIIAAVLIGNIIRGYNAIWNKFVTTKKS
ncbi:MAG: DUF6198 family protein [Lachnospiraceae bacterium]|nr:DUF6198 family protein [Lachnospiraceae bacterium]